MRYVDVILPVPLEGTFTYTISDEMAAACTTGVRVLVPFGKSKTYAGVVVRVHDDGAQVAESKLKAVLSVLDASPVLLSHQLKLWQWIASYYMSPLGDVLNAALPAGLKADTAYRPKTESYVKLAATYHSEQALHVALNLLARSHKQYETFLCYLRLSRFDEAFTQTDATWQPNEVTREELMNEARCSAAILKRLVTQGFLEVYEKEIGRLNDAGQANPENISPLSEPQQQAYDNIISQWKAHPVVLLHGVTSSGKTEIYIHLIQKAISEGKQVLYLLPEIALTVQMTQRLRRVFGNRLGIYPSKYSDAERVEIWRRQLSSSPYDVILGARSAVFLPFQRLGLVIVDEEHESSFKQQDPAPRYHARSVSIVLARMFGAKTVLGTATPSMESYYNAQTGKYGLVSLSTRFRGIELPEIEVVDIHDLRHRKLMNGPFSPLLLKAMREAFSEGKQVILFQNRRGFAPMIECRVCGWVPKCKNCDVSLTYHKRLNVLTCHYCGYTMPVPQTCPNCENPNLSGRGYGTEKIEDLIAELFPEVRVARMDLDTTRTRNAYERLITEFGSGRTHVLIGTQMVTKGLDFDKVAVVGILDADSMLNYPDFRAYEQAFMMMSQVSGRAGRRGQRGRVILQTRNPQLPVIQQVVHNDYASFYADLLVEREMFRYPPFYHLAYIYLKHKHDELVEMAAQEMGAQLRHIFADRVLGPDKPAVARVKAMSIRKIVIKLENGIDQRRVREQLIHIRTQLLAQPAYRSLHIYFDVDPM